MLVSFLSILSLLSAGTEEEWDKNIHTSKYSFQALFSEE